MSTVALPGSVLWRAVSGTGPFSDVTEPLLAAAPVETIQDRADALVHDSRPRATAYMPMDPTISVTDSITVQIDGEPVAGTVTTVEHVVRSGQALTRVEMLL